MSQKQAAAFHPHRNAQEAARGEQRTNQPPVDPRFHPAVEAIMEQERMGTVPVGVAVKVGLAAADAKDREQGIHRVKLDYEALERVARILASIEGDEWVFNPPIMDGLTREATAKEVYIRRARAIIEALKGQP